MIRAVKSISSSSSAYYFSALLVTSGPLALFFKMISIAVAFISSKSTIFTICLPNTSYKAAKHTVRLTAVLVPPGPHSCLYLDMIFPGEFPHVPTCYSFSDDLLHCLFQSIEIDIAKHSILHSTCDPFLNFLHMNILHLHFITW
jgi:hypothetical protein